MTQINQSLTTILAECPQENLIVEDLLIVPVTSSTDSSVIAASRLQENNFGTEELRSSASLELGTNGTARRSVTARIGRTRFLARAASKKDDLAPSHALPSFLSCRDDMMDAVL
jgi:hypothetical protein